MIYCKDCKYFDPLPPPLEWKGTCEIVLPPWVPMAEDNISRCVRDDDGCSLGTQRVSILLSPI
jgi:hypothetical protein